MTSCPTGKDLRITINQDNSTFFDPEICASSTTSTIKITSHHFTEIRLTSKQLQATIVVLLINDRGIQKMAREQHTPPEPPPTPSQR